MSLLTDLQTHRRYLLGVAYRMLGTLSEAEDVVQEAALRVREVGDVDSPRAYLTRW